MKSYHDSKIDYSGRTVDMLLLQYVYAPNSDTTVVPDVSATPKIVTGIEKMAQRFALVFLTQLGTIRNCEDEGTDFMNLLGNGRIFDDSSLRSAASSANSSALRQIRQEDSELSTPDDEKLKSSEVTELEMNRSTSTVSVKITLTAESGDTYTYITPINTGV